MRIQGACHCRDISYEAVIDPARVSICHCTDCQALTGFELRSGSPKVYIKTGDSGAKRAQVLAAVRRNLAGVPLGSAEAQEAIDRAKEPLVTLRSYLRSHHLPLLK